MTNKYEYIDAITSGVKATPDLIGKTVQIISAELVDSTVAKNTFFKLGMVAGSEFESTAMFDVFVPDGFLLYRENNVC